jgi:hypothetical protein
VIVSKQGDSDYSPTWKWSADEELGGTHVEFRKANVEGLEKVVWEIETPEHGPVSVWLDPAVLVQKVRDELKRRKAERGAARLEPGERVRLNPGEKRASKSDASRSMWPFPLVWFEHGVPDRSAEELLLDDDTASDDFDPEAEGGLTDDNLPF